MTKIWVLDTETKGTGAEMVPLEKVLERRPARSLRPEFVGPRTERPDEPVPAPEKEPYRFRVVDVEVSVWDAERDSWRMLTLGEQKRLWDLRRPRSDRV